MEKQNLARKKTFPEILKYQRELRGWSQAKMSEVIGATPNRISLWERGAALPGAYFREKLCTCLDMDATQLGLLAVDEEVRPDAPTDEEDKEKTLIDPAIMIDKPAALQNLQATQGPTKHRLYGVVAGRRWYRVSLLLALVLILLVVVGSIASFRGAFNGILNPNQTNPYPPHTGLLVLHDALHDQSSGVDWQEGNNEQQASCVFKEDGYVAYQPVTGYFHACVAQKTDYTDFTFEVLMTIQQGEFGGIVFRSEDSIDAHYYIFRVHSDGSYWLYRFVDRNIDDATLLDSGKAQIFNKGLNKSNRLAVVAQGSVLTLYINSHQVTSLQDGGYTHGQIGVLAGSINQGPAQVLFQDVNVWS